ncbi:MAG TPA: hypothetical protein PLP25_00645 [Candidatus Limiplasma sp.]|nr:hypothetical protein [Candidatus Limiplasma sp.]HPS80351.1 hypothetical protein [Candidatus Limiplasma sp.]
MKAYWPKLLENGIILALLTGTAYYLTYLRLDGSLAAYALPDELIEIDAPDIIATMIDLVYKFWRVLIIPVIGLMLGKLFKDAEIIRLWRFSIVMVTSVVFSVSLLNRFEAKNWILLGIIGFAWGEALVKTLLYGRADHGLRAKWESYRQKAASAKEINERMASGLGYLAVMIAVLSVLSGAVMEHAATVQLDREDYFVARDYGDQVVVFQNGTCYALMARDGNELLPAYEMVRYDHIGKLDYVHTGVLSLPSTYPAYD